MKAEAINPETHERKTKEAVAMHEPLRGTA
jgi:hypothetical protein